MEGSKLAGKILESYRELVWKELRGYLYDPVFPRTFRVAAEWKNEEKFHWKLVKEYPLRKGKYLRPALLILIAEAMGLETGRALRVACAMQLSEEWLLIHDDFEDGSLKRRGLPALQRMYNPELAVNAGDTLHIIMWKIIWDACKELDGERANLILNEFYMMLMRTALGQTVEIEWTKINKLSFSDEDWFFVADGKTSYYTIAGPMRLGAILSGAKKSQLEKLAVFGKYLGRCFQLVDDVLDLTSDFTGLKEKGNDIYEGKRTVILGHLMRKLQGLEKQKLMGILKKSRDKKTEKEVNWILNKMDEAGSISYAKALAEKFKTKASDVFERDMGFLKCEPARSHLRLLIDYIVERDR